MTTQCTTSSGSNLKLQETCLSQCIDLTSCHGGNTTDIRQEHQY
jgi:hypothetical protein